MATRFYLPSTGAAAISPAFDASWEYTDDADVVRRAAVKTRISSSMASVVVTRSADTSPADVLVRQYVYGPIGAQTITGTAKGQIRGDESTTSYDARTQAVLRVVSSDGSTVRGVLYAGDDGALASEFSTTLTNRKIVPRAPVTLTDVAAQDGDYLVIEVGYRTHGGGSTSRSGTLSFGDNSATDLAENETTTTANNPWVEFSFNIADAGGGGGVARPPQVIWIA